MGSNALFEGERLTPLQGDADTCSCCFLCTRWIESQRNII